MYPVKGIKQLHKYMLFLSVSVFKKHDWLYCVLKIYLLGK